MKMQKKLALCLICLLMVIMSGCNTGEAKEAEVAVVEEAVETMAEETIVVEEAVAEETTIAEEVVAEEATVVEETTAEVNSAQTAENSETGQIISISMAEMEEKLAAGEPFLVSFVTINCPYCQDFHSMLVDYIQEHIVTMYQVILDYEEKPEAENREIIKGYFNEFNTVPGVFYVINGKDGDYRYLDTYNLGVGMEVFDEWVQENNIETK